MYKLFVFRKNQTYNIYTDLVMYCVVYYKNQTKYSNLKNLSELNIDRIQLAKEKCMRIGGAYSHEEQCSMIPLLVNHEIHGVHLESCYKP